MGAPLVIFAVADHEARDVVLDVADLHAIDIHSHGVLAVWISRLVDELNLVAGFDVGKLMFLELQAGDMAAVELVPIEIVVEFGLHSGLIIFLFGCHISTLLLRFLLVQGERSRHYP